MPSALQGRTCASQNPAWSRWEDVTPHHLPAFTPGVHTYTMRRLDGGIRTPGLLAPNQARYQATLHPGMTAGVGLFPYPTLGSPSYSERDSNAHRPA